MIKISTLFAHWMWEKGYRKELSLLYFGHIEELTDDMLVEYYEWLKSEECKKYLEELNREENQ